MKKSTQTLWIFLVILFIILTGCGKKNSSPTTETNWAQIIYSDLLSGTTEIEKTISKTVIIAVDEYENQQIQVTITAPEICDSLLLWIENVTEEEFTEESLEVEILQLLHHIEPSEKIFTLSYFIDDEGPHVQYTQEFANAVTCGLTRFYAEITQRVLDSLEVE